MAKIDQEKVLKLILLEKCDERIEHWFGRFDRGFTSLVTVEAAQELLDEIEARDELRRETAA